MIFSSAKITEAKFNEQEIKWLTEELSLKIDNKVFVTILERKYFLGCF